MPVLSRSVFCILRYTTKGAVCAGRDSDVHIYIMGDLLFSFDQRVMTGVSGTIFAGK